MGKAEERKSDPEADRRRSAKESRQERSHRAARASRERIFKTKAGTGRPAETASFRQSERKGIRERRTTSRSAAMR